LPSGLFTIQGRLDLGFSRKHPSFEKIIKTISVHTLFPGWCTSGEAGYSGMGENIKLSVKIMPEWHTKG